MISTEVESNRQRKCTCCKPSLGRMISMIMYLLLLLAELVATFTFIYYFGKSVSPVFTSESHLKTTNVSSSTKNASHVFPIQLVRYFGMTETYSRLIMAVKLFRHSELLDLSWSSFHISAFQRLLPYDEKSYSFAEILDLTICICALCHRECY